MENDNHRRVFPFRNWTHECLLSKSLILNHEQKDKWNKNTTRRNSITTTNSIPCLLEMHNKERGRPWKAMVQQDDVQLISSFHGMEGNAKQALISNCLQSLTCRMMLTSFNKTNPRYSCWEEHETHVIYSPLTNSK